jgi:hypothetical protein
VKYLLFAVAILFSCHHIEGQQQHSSPMTERPTIKGHSINETLEEFLHKEPAAAAKIEQCRKDPKSDSTTHLLSGKQAREFSRNIARGVPAVLSTCAEITRGSITVMDSGTFLFQQGVLVSIWTVAGGGYFALADDLTKRFGKRDREWALPYHNAFGATWENHTSEWDNPDVYVRLDEDNNPAGPGDGTVCSVSVQSHAFHEQVARARASAPSPLDRK